jgi:hypothetical protein
MTARIFDRRADRLRLALAKGFLVSLLATIIQSVVLWITS